VHKNKKNFKNLMDAMEKNFREAALNSTSASTPSPFKNMLNKLFYSTWGWSLLTVLFVFVFLYCLNPPIIQCKRDDNDMSKASPNTLTIFIISLVAGAAVLSCTYFLSPSSSASSSSSTFLS